MFCCGQVWQGACTRGGLRRQSRMELTYRNSESKKPQRKVLPEPSVVHCSCEMVPPMGHPYT